MPPKIVQQIKADIEARRQPETTPIPPQHPQHSHHLHLPHLHLHNHLHRSHSTPPSVQPTNAVMSAQSSPAPGQASLTSILDTAEAQWRPAFDSTKTKNQIPLRPPTSNRPSWIGPKPADRRTLPGQHTMPQPVKLKYTSPGLQPPVFAFTSLSEPQWEPVEMDAHKNEKGEWVFTKTFSAHPGDYQYKYRLGPGEWWALDAKKPTVDDGFGNKNNLLVVKEPVSQKLSEGRAHAPLLPHEAVPVPALSPAQIPAENSTEKETAHLDTESTTVAPLLAHEEIAVENKPNQPWHGNEEEVEPHSSPLLRHESLGPDSAEQCHSPLFRHETIALGEHKDDHLTVPTPTTPTDAHFHVPPEADPHDPHLEKFPSDHNGILEHIHRTSTLLPADETTEESIGSPSSGASENGNRLSSLTSLRSVHEDEEELDHLHEIERKDAESKHLALITPPMTPKDEDQIAQDIVAGLMAGVSVDEAIERAVESDIIREELAEIAAEAKAQDDERHAEKLAPVAVERRTVLEILMSPPVCLAIVGVALALGAVGFFVGKGDVSGLFGK